MSCLYSFPSSPPHPAPHFDLVFCGDSSKSDLAVCIHNRLLLSSNGELQQRFVCEGTTLYLEGGCEE